MPLQNTFDAAPQTDVGFDTVTPGQGNTRLVLDVPDTVCIEAGTAKFRTAKNITILSETGADTLYSQHVRRWSSGCITTGLVQESFAFTYELDYLEKADPGSIVATWNQETPLIRAMDMSAVAGVSVNAAKQWAAPIGDGFIKLPGTAESGDTLYQRVIQAGQSWEPTNRLFPPPPQESGDPGLDPVSSLFTSSAVPLDTMGYSQYTHDADQGFFLRWLSPGSPFSTPGTILNFHFGQYCLIIGGNGVATLAEWCQPKDGGAYRWRRRTEFRYCRMGDGVAKPHTMSIFPHKGVHGQKYIAFVGANVESPLAKPTFFATSQVTGEFLYEATAIIRGADKDESPESVTRTGNIRLDVRRDLRIGIHLSKLLFWRTGFINDGAVGIPDYATLTQGGVGYEPRPFEVDFLANYPADAEGNRGRIDYTIRDAQTLDENAVRHPSVNIRLVGSATPNLPQSVTGRVGASFRSPILWGYTLSRPAQLETAAPGAFTLPVRTARVDDHTGPSAESAVAQVSAHVTTPESIATFPATAPGSVLARLNNRSRFQARLLMDYQASPGAVIEPVVLARGTATLPQGVKRGKPGGTFPEWHEYSFLMASVRDKLQAVTALAIDYENFAVDKTAPKEKDDKQPAWKVVDIIRFLLKSRGFLDEQIIVPDLPFRLWSGASTAKSDAEYNAYTDVLGQCQALCRNYLGAYLIWDVNAGPPESVYTNNVNDKTPTGAWRVMQPPKKDAVPVMNFVTAPIETADAPGLKDSFTPVHSPDAYPDATTFVIGELINVSYAPEFNHLWVFTVSSEAGTKGFRTDRHLFNPKSYNVPGMTTRPDPDSPHYIGHERLYILPCPELNAPGNDAQTRRAVDWTARRIFDFAGRGRKGYKFTAPLVLIEDEETGRKRPLRYYDPVSMNGEAGFFVRSVSFEIKSLQHTARYEIEKIISI